MVVSHDRYFLENVAGRVIELDRAYRRRAVRGARAATAQFLEKKDAAARRAGELPGVARATACGARSTGCARKARARTRKAQARIDEAGAPAASELSDLDARAQTAAVGIDFAGDRAQDRSGSSWPRVWRRATATRAIVRGLDLVLSPGTRLGLLGRERQRQDARCCALLAGERGARRGHGRARAAGSRSSCSTSTARGSTRRVSLRRDARARTATRWSIQGRADPRRRLGEALPVPLRAARDAGGPALGRRAGARRCSPG